MLKPEKYYSQRVNQNYFFSHEIRFFNVKSINLKLYNNGAASIDPQF